MINVLFFPGCELSVWLGGLVPLVDSCLRIDLFFGRFISEFCRNMFHLNLLSMSFWISIHVFGISWVWILATVKELMVNVNY